MPKPLLIEFGIHCRLEIYGACPHKKLLNSFIIKIQLGIFCLETSFSSRFVTNNLFGMVVTHSLGLCRFLAFQLAGLVLGRGGPGAFFALLLAVFVRLGAVQVFQEDFVGLFQGLLGDDGLGRFLVFFGLALTSTIFLFITLRVSLQKD